MKKRIARSSMLAVIAVVMPMAGHAAIITQTVDNVDWNDAIWGSPAAAPSGGNDYVSAAVGTARFRILAASTFGGDSLTLVSGTRLLSKMQGDSTATINGDFTADGGWVSFAPNSSSSLANSTLTVANFNVTDNSTFSMGAFTAATTIDGTLTGSGNLLFYLENAAHATNDQIVSFSDVSGYTGALTVTEKLGIEFGVDYTFDNTVTIQDASSFLIVNSGQTLTFAEGALVDSGGTVAPGTYTGAALDALGANYVNNGGTVVVVPEPATISLIAALGGGMLFFRRRFRM